MGKKLSKGDTIDGHVVVQVKDSGDIIIRVVESPKPSLYEKLVMIGARAGGGIKPDSFYECLTTFIKENFVPKEAVQSGRFKGCHQCFKEGVADGLLQGRKKAMDECHESQRDTAHVATLLQE